MKPTAIICAILLAGATATASAQPGQLPTRTMEFIQNTWAVEILAGLCHKITPKESGNFIERYSAFADRNFGKDGQAQLVGPLRQALSDAYDRFGADPNTACAILTPNVMSILRQMINGRRGFLP